MARSSWRLEPDRRFGPRALGQDVVSQSKPRNLGLFGRDEFQESRLSFPRCGDLFDPFAVGTKSTRHNGVVAGDVGARGCITLLLRTILESEGNGDALIEPVVSAVGLCMRPIWIRRGLEWIAAFDRIPLVEILNKLRELDLFPEDELQHHFAIGIGRRLWRIFGPDVVPAAPKAKPPRAVKQTRAQRPLKRPGRRMAA
jgi:hypothetical protein